MLRKDIFSVLMTDHGYNGMAHHLGSHIGVVTTHNSNHDLAIILQNLAFTGGLAPIPLNLDLELKSGTNFP